MTEDGITTTGHIIIGAFPIVVHMTRKSNQWHNKFNCVGNLYRIVAIFLIQGVVLFAMMINGEWYVSALCLQKMIIERLSMFFFVYSIKFDMWFQTQKDLLINGMKNSYLLCSFGKKTPNLELEMKSCNGFLVLWKHILMSWSLWGSLPFGVYHY